MKSSRFVIAICRHLYKFLAHLCKWAKRWKSCHAELDVHIWSFPDLPPSVFTQSLTWYLNLKICYWFKVPYSGCQLHNKIFGSFPAQFSIIENSILGSTFIIILLEDIITNILKECDALVSSNKVGKIKVLLQCPLWCVEKQHFGSFISVKWCFCYTFTF